MTPLVAWVRAADETRGIRFARAGDEWDFWSYARLSQRTREVASALLDAGVQRDDVVAIVTRSGPAFVTGFFGTLLCGATASPIAAPLLFENSAAYQEAMTALLQSARPAVVLAEHDAHDEVERCARAAGVRRVLAIDDLVVDAARDFNDEDTPPHIALLQFTSGSSALRRGVQVSTRALEANVQAIRSWLHWTKADAFASWLPLHHDMGLIGALVSSVVGQSDLWLLQPEQFVRHPHRYLQCFGRLGAVLSVMPNFGLDYISRRVRPEALAGCDFSGWRGLVVGAERVDATSLARFTSLLGPFGFNPLTLLPAYGLAEATLAVTGLPLEEMWTSVAVDPACLSLDRDVVLVSGEAPSEVVVGCGRPVGDASIAIIDQSGRSVPDGRVGEIVVRSTSVASGYIDSRELATTAIEDGLLNTGDAGFIRDGQLFVLGRLGDSLKVRGRIVFTEQLEVAIAARGIPRERIAALLGMHRGAPTAIVVIERSQFDADDIFSLIRLHAGNARPLIVSAPAGTIARTTSGKPQRRLLWQSFVDGTLPGRLTSASISSRDTLFD